MSLNAKQGVIKNLKERIEFLKGSITNSKDEIKSFQKTIDCNVLRLKDCEEFLIELEKL